eukprot:54591-Rhodomonas_salina.1
MDGQGKGRESPCGFGHCNFTRAADLSPASSPVQKTILGTIMASKSQQNTRNGQAEEYCRSRNVDPGQRILKCPFISIPNFCRMANEFEM